VALESQTKTPQSIESLESAAGQAAGKVAWTNPGNAFLLDDSGGAFANSSIRQFASSNKTEYLVWTDFGFSVDPFADFSGFTIRHGMIHAVTGVVWSTNSKFILNNLVIGNATMTSQQSPTGSFEETIHGGPTNKFAISKTLTELFDPTFGITVTGQAVTLTGTVQIRHYGTELTLWYETPDNAINTSLNTATRIGNARVRSTDNDGIRHLHFDCASNFNISNNENIFIQGNPISIYENNTGQKAIAVYDVSGSLDGDLSLSRNALVNEGFRLSFLENNNHRVLRAKTTASHSVEPSGSVVWMGIPLSTNAFGDIVAKKITGTISQTRKFSFGGVPLTAVFVDGIWAIAVSDI